MFGDILQNVRGQSSECLAIFPGMVEDVLFHYSILNFFLTCSSFLSFFSLTAFIKLFLIQKSKSGTNLKHKEEKQEEATID